MRDWKNVKPSQQRNRFTVTDHSSRVQTGTPFLAFQLGILGVTVMPHSQQVEFRTWSGLSLVAGHGVWRLLAHLFRTLSGCGASMQRSWTLYVRVLEMLELSQLVGNFPITEDTASSFTILEDFAAFYLGPTHPNVQPSSLATAQAPHHQQAREQAPLITFG
jgi:hypothetical protein